MVDTIKRYVVRFSNVINKFQFQFEKYAVCCSLDCGAGQLVPDARFGDAQRNDEIVVDGRVVGSSAIRHSCRCLHLSLSCSFSLTADMDEQMEVDSGSLTGSIADI